jgi:C-1 hydroxylase
VSLEENKAIVRKMVEAANARNVDLMNEIVAPDFVDHKRQLQGLEVLKQWATTIFKSFSDFHETIEDIVAEGDKVWVRIKITGTHTGEFLGLAPTGKKFTETSVDIFRIDNGKLVEGWNVTDELDFLKQLGVIEYTEKGKKLFPEPAK